MEHETSNHHLATKLKKKLDHKSNLMIALGAVIIILIVVAIVSFGGDKFNFSKNLTPDEAKTKAEEFINKNLVAEGTSASIIEISEYNKGLYKLKVKYNENDIESYITKDGKQFFTNAYDIDQINNEVSDEESDSAPTVTPENVPKADKPKVEVFVMSHCPYGTQIEKGLVPVMETLGNKAEIEIKFVNYAMHDQIEIEDNIKQYCIGKEQGDKYVGFLKCFLNSGDSKSCVTSSGVNQAKLDSCYNATDKKFSLMKDFNDKNTWNGSFPPFSIHQAENEQYDIQGSPTLVINGSQIESGRDSASLLAAICAGFNEAPAECSTTLASASPAPGFGSGTTSDSTDASCN